MKENSETQKMKEKLENVLNNDWVKLLGVPVAIGGSLLIGKKMFYDKASEKTQMNYKRALYDAAFMGFSLLTAEITNPYKNRSQCSDASEKDEKTGTSNGADV